MINDIHFPEQLSASELDAYLAKGWYRMGQVIFTTNYIVYEDVLYRVYWLRYSVPEIHFNKTHQKIMNLNQGFSVAIRPLAITEELEELYAAYLSGVTFQAPESIQHFLFDGGMGDVYNSSVVEIRDKGRIIAAGIFDHGENSIAGIMNFYHPDYKKYSLGKYLMLLKVRFAKAVNKQWYYPGYIVEGNPRFDYKLFIGKDIASIYFPEFNNWANYSDNWPVVE